MTSAIYIRLVFFCFRTGKGWLKHNVPGKTRFHLTAGIFIFPKRYRIVDVDGLVSSDGDKSRGWKKSVRIFISVNFLRKRR